jgi:UDP-N-acetylmuramyl pentapeptide phosphotransferase/UDP-N-acetylglucosamine-1-phosphate transferase
VDNPDGERRVHTKITPRMGGIIVFAVALVMIFGFYENINDYRFFVISMLIMVACGILDDLLDVSWNLKFLLQFVSITFLMIQIYPDVTSIEILGFNLPLFLGYFILFVFAVGTVNSINLMDGLDGLVSGYSLIKMAVIL